MNETNTMNTTNQSTTIPYLSSSDIRNRFKQFFEKHQHTWVASSSLVPAQDPTLLFTNAGMVQFKDVFLGYESRDYTRAASSQRCVRAGGKHNDLERVGLTARHHTFFEMLGNFSFGDYFKREAIVFAWNFLTKELNLPKEKLWITVFKDDIEAEKIWLEEMGVDPSRFSRCGEDDNFWSMGATGPCGPCTEIFYDHGDHIWGGPPGSPDADGDRYIEIWNLVFMQYNRDANGLLSPLPKPSVDTGMGLERISAVMQGVHNNYDTDLFIPLIKAAAKLCNQFDTSLTSLRVLADHIRSASFLICDGVLPNNEGRGYVLRRIIRRALRHGNQLGQTQVFFHQLVPTLVSIMGQAYPELIQHQEKITQIILQEENLFSGTLNQGLKLFREMISQLKDSVIPGHIVFKLYDTYGFPVDLTADLARDYQLSIDEAGFEIAMETQRQRSRDASQFNAEQIAITGHAPTEFTGYLPHHSLSQSTLPSRIIALYKDGQFVNELKAGEKGSVILDSTPFYAESGGQVGDMGELKNDSGLFKVLDTVKQGKTHLHLGKCEKGKLTIDSTILPTVDTQRRSATVLNHTATHLLHHALRSILGNEVVQKGSLVAPDRLRFDFAYSHPLETKQLIEIEDVVNQAIRDNARAQVNITTPEDAQKQGALALFGEKYGREVRVVQFGHSIELCGGTHAEQTGDIGIFKIISESGIAAGIRRIEAITGTAALIYWRQQMNEFEKRLAESLEKEKKLEKELQTLKEKQTLSACKLLEKNIKFIESKSQTFSYLIALTEDIEGKQLRVACDYFTAKYSNSIIILAHPKALRLSVVISVSPALTEQISARDLLKELNILLDGKGGGKSDFAEGGAPYTESTPSKFMQFEKTLQTLI